MMGAVTADRVMTKVPFADFYAAEHARVFRAAYLFCGDREVASDATQEAFKRAFARWRRLRREPWAGGWVTTTALNLCRRQLRLNRRESQLDVALTSKPDPEMTRERVDIERALRRLALRQRQAVVLYYLADLPVAAVAQLMGISEGSVKAHLSQARDNLRRILESSG